MLSGTLCYSALLQIRKSSWWGHTLGWIAEPAVYGSVPPFTKPQKRTRLMPLVARTLRQTNALLSDSAHTFHLQSSDFTLYADQRVICVFFSHLNSEHAATALGVYSTMRCMCAP